MGQLLFAPWAWAYSTLHTFGVGKWVPAYGWEGIRQVCATLLGACHVPERLCGGPSLQRGTITFSFITDRRVYLSQVTYTPLHPQSVWTSDDVAPHPALVNYGGSALPHLRPNVASTAQTFAATPVAPVPRPPATVRSRPLSAGARNRQYRDRPATDPNMPNTRYGEKSLLHYVNFTSSWSK